MPQEQYSIRASAQPQHNGTRKKIENRLLTSSNASLQRYNRGLFDDWHHLADRYRNGDIEIVARAMVDGVAGYRKLVFHRIPLGGSKDLNIPKITAADDRTYSHCATRQEPVFVDVPEMVCGPKGEIATSVWLEQTDSLRDFQRDAIALAPNGCFYAPFFPSERESQPVGPVGAHAARGCYGKHGLIERGPGVSDAINRMIDKYIGDAPIPSDPMEIMRTIRIEIGDRFLFASSHEIFKGNLEVLSLSFRPAKPA